VQARLRLSRFADRGTRLSYGRLGVRQVPAREQHFVGDGLAGALHHERQRHNMSLTIHYQLATTGDEAHARKLVQQLRQAALDLPFLYVGEIAESRRSK
jgi:hypothetical protein